MTLTPAEASARGFFTDERDKFKSALEAGAKKDSRRSQQPGSCLESGRQVAAVHLARKGSLPL